MKALNLIKNIILDIIIVILVVSIIFGFLNKNKPVPVMGYYFFTVMSGSMEDSLHVGDSIISKKVDNYKVGDIVTYKVKGAYVTHRIVKIKGNSVTTKGDANQIEDPAFDKSEILCKFVYKSGWLNFLVRNRIFIVLFVIIIFLVEAIVKETTKKEE